MGSGKSTLAPLLAQALGSKCIDSDNYIESQEKRSITEIFASQGEQHFRNLEQQFIHSFENTQNYIIATGGGMPIFNDISKLGICLYLQVDFKIITQRVMQSPNIRPLFCDLEKAKQLFIQREPTYIRASNIIINANSTPEHVFQDTMKVLHDQINQK